jgi:hypothetical protein
MPAGIVQAGRSMRQLGQHGARKAAGPGAQGATLDARR